MRNHIDVTLFCKDRIGISLGEKEYHGVLKEKLVRRKKINTHNSFIPLLKTLPLCFTDECLPKNNHIYLVYFAFGAILLDKLNGFTYRDANRNRNSAYKQPNVVIS